MVDFELQEEIQRLQDLANYDIANEYDISDMDAQAVTAVLVGAVEALADSSDSITEPAVFDAYRSLLKHAEHLQGTTMSKLLDSISSAFQAQVEATSRDLDDEDPEMYKSHKTSLEMYAFLFQWFVTAAEKVKATGEEEAPPAPARGRRGRGGKAATSRSAAAKRKEGWTWQDQIPAALTLLSKVLKLKTQRIWTTTAEKEAFVGYVHLPFPASVA